MNLAESLVRLPYCAGREDEDSIPHNLDPLLLLMLVSAFQQFAKTCNVKSVIELYPEYLCNNS